ncbi:MAG: SOS response-associated peptidase [Agitococcus sp.]|nr:SOS response-associated peptidase [Agitococcus sp.]
MCGRLEFNESITLSDFFERHQFPLFPYSNNIAPTEAVPVIIYTTQLELRPMRWWLLPSWVSEPSTKFSMFNARSDSITTSKAFRVPFQRRRCVVPVSGFYEWQREEKTKTPYLVKTIDSPMLLGGIWDIWERNGAHIESFAIITTDASDEMAWLHNRQPVFIPESRMDHWLNPKTPIHELGDLLLPNLPYSLEAIPVSNKVGNSRYKSLIDVVGEPILMSP